jgi:hypothetical protein
MIPTISREAIFGLQNLSYVSPEHNRPLTHVMHALVSFCF